MSACETKPRATSRCVQPPGAAKSGNPWHVREYRAGARSTDVFGRVLCDAREQHFVFSSNERAQIQNVRIEAHAILVQFADAPARKKKITPPVARDETRHRRMIARPEAHDHILDRGHTFTFQIAYRAT